jgi:hypothetical protein
MKNKTLADLMREEAKRINNGFCYSTWPYPCSIGESLGHARHYQAPANPKITHTEEGRLVQTEIEIKPRPGSGKRKPLTINLYWYK